MSTRFVDTPNASCSSSGCTRGRQLRSVPGQVEPSYGPKHRAAGPRSRGDMVIPRPPSNANVTADPTRRTPTHHRIARPMIAPVATLPVIVRHCYGHADKGHNDCRNDQ